MKKLKASKLALSTETLAPLTGAELGGVNGGDASGTLTQLTRTLISAACPISLACPTLRCFGGGK